MAIRENCAPDRVGVEYRFRTTGSGDLDMQARFSRWPRAGRAQNGGIGVDLDDRIEVEAALRHSTPCHGQPERVPLEDDAEVPAGPEHPVACVEASANLRQQPGGLLEVP